MSFSCCSSYFISTHDFSQNDLQQPQRANVNLLRSALWIQKQRWVRATVTERQLIHLRKTKTDSCYSRHFMSCSCITFWFIEAAAGVEVVLYVSWKAYFCCMGLTLSGIWSILYTPTDPPQILQEILPWWPAKNNSVYSCLCGIIFSGISASFLVHLKWFILVRLLLQEK